MTAITKGIFKYRFCRAEEPALQRSMRAVTKDAPLCPPTVAQQRPACRFQPTGASYPRLTSVSQRNLKGTTVRQDGNLQHFIDRLEHAIFSRLAEGSSEWNVAQEIFGALKRPGTPHSPHAPESLPAQQFLTRALDNAAGGPADITGVADAFRQLSPRLAWYRRKNAELAGKVFMDGHANAVLIGEDGLERRSDIQIGVSLMAPHIQYVDHHHPPAEIYLVMSPGAWRQEQRPWHEPGIGGTVYNTPNIVHAMKSAEQPLFAVWCLLVK
jgi:hypothetical protein